jgi:hypothetical protein
MAEPLKGTPLPDEKPGGPDADFLREARERYVNGWQYDQDNREEAQEDLEFGAGEQWPQEIRKERKEDNRPILTFNQMPKFVHQVAGDIRQNKPAIKVRPADDVSDEETADIFSGLIRHVEARSDAGIAYQTAAEGAAWCGIGHFRIVTEYSTDDTFEQDIRIRRITDYAAVTWDPEAVEPTREDARWCFVEQSMDREGFKKKYPKASTADFDFTREQEGSVPGWQTRDSVRVAEYWTKTPEKRTLALLEDGRTIDATDLAEVDLAAMEEPPVTESGLPVKAAYVGEDNDILLAVRTRVVWRDKVEMRVINGVEVLEGPFHWPGRHIPVIPVLGEEIHVGRRTVRHGVIRFAKDPQRAYNFWRTAQTEMIALQPKVPWLVTITNIHGLESYWRQANNRNLPYLLYRPDEKNNGAAPSRNVPQMGSSGMAQEILLASEDLKSTTGIYDAALGARSNEKSGIAIAQRKQESDVGTFAYSDNLTRALRYAGRQLVDLIPKVYDTERTIRVLNEDESTEAVVINQKVTDPETGKETAIHDITIGKYDVVVSTGPSFTTKRQEAAAGMIDWMKADPEGASLIRDLIAKNLDWPGADEMAERFRKALPPGLVEPEEDEEPAPEQPPTPEQQAAMMEAQTAQAEQQRKALESAAKAEKTEAETEGLRLDNAKKALELALADGVLDPIVDRLIEQRLAEMSNPQPGQQQQPAMAGGPGPQQ